VVNRPALVSENKPPIPAMMVMKRAGTPVIAGSERGGPIPMGKPFPPLKLNDALKTEAARQIAHAPGHDSNAGIRKAPQGGLMKMVEMGVRQENEVDRWQILNLEAGAPEAFEQEQPVREVGVHQDIEVVELDEKRRMTDPGDRDLSVFELGELGLLGGARTPGDQGLPNHLMEEGPGAEMIAWREFAERSWDASAWLVWGCIFGWFLAHVPGGP